MADQSRQHYTRRVATTLRATMLGGAKEIAERLAFPSERADGTELPVGEFVAMHRENRVRDGRYVSQVLDQLAPPTGIPGADGTVMRSEVGLDHFNALALEAWPDLYAQAALELKQTKGRG